MKNIIRLTHHLLLLSSNTMSSSSDPEVNFIANQMKEANEKASATAASAPGNNSSSSDPNPALDGSAMANLIHQETDPEVKFIMKQTHEAGNKA